MMLELGKAGSHGVGRGVLPVLIDGAVVATLQAARWGEAATVTVADRAWVYARQGGELTGRRASDPEHTTRLRARKTAWLDSSWSLDLEGRAAELTRASLWKQTYRVVADGRQVAETGRTDGWSPRPTLTVEPVIPLDQQVFLLWVAWVARRRSSGDGAGFGGDGGGGGGGD